MIAGIIVLAGLCHHTEPVPERFEFESKHMGTTFRIVLYAPDKTTAKKAADAVFARVTELDICMSDYKPSSELMRLGHKFSTEVGPPVAVSDDLFTVLAKADELSRRSEGAFDVTVGPVVQLWRLARRTQELPDPKELAAARAKVGYQKVKLDPAKKTVQLTTPGMQLDLGGIAKGFAADEALKLLREKFDISRALIAAAGDIACGDPPPGREAWTVDIAPIAKSQKPRRLNLARAAVSTSGDLEQFVVIGGVRYSHVLDPRTGQGLTGRRSVTVIAPRGIDADSMTKAVSVLPRDAALKLVEDTPGAAAYLVTVEKDEKPIIVASKRFPKFVSND
jgi:FAD:protein FMN transferase